MKMPTSQFLAVCYADIFDYPLTKNEPEKWQISSLSLRGASKTSDVAISSKKKKIAALPTVARNDGVAVRVGFYYLSGRENIIKLRQQRKIYSQEKLLIAQKISNIFKFIPFIKLIAVTGALAVDNSPKDDDIDLLIITRKNRVWLTRVLSIIILEILGQRRRPKDKNIKNKVCLNMFLEENNLEVPPPERNLYVAHEIVQIKPLYDKDNTYERFLLRNKWVKEYLPRVFPQVLKPSTSVIARSEATKQSSPSFFDFLELLAYKLQYFYMQKRITRETVEKGRIMFHPRDTSTWVLKEFDKRVKIYYH